MFEKGNESYLFFTDDAKSDIRNNYEWYEEQREGLGEEFLVNLHNTLENVKRNPLHYQLLYKEQRAALLSRFPYRVFYFIDQDKIIVQGVIRTSRDPSVWQERNT